MTSVDVADVAGRQIVAVEAVGGRAETTLATAIHKVLVGLIAQGASRKGRTGDAVSYGAGLAPQGSGIDEIIDGGVTKGTCEVY